MIAHTTRYRKVNWVQKAHPALFVATTKHGRPKDVGHLELASNSDCQIHRLNGKRLAVEVKVEDVDIRDANLVFVKSPKGTGKTKFLRRYLKTIPTYRHILAVVHRRTLARMLSNELSLHCYLDEGKFQHGYVISIDSLIKFDTEKDHPYDVLVLDESEQVFRHLIAETTEQNRGKIFRTLVWLIRGAKQIICSDADLTGDLTVHLISKLRSSFEQEQSIAIINEWKTDRTIEVYQNKQHLIADLVCDLADGKRIYIPVGELGLVDRITSLLPYIFNPDGTPISVLELTGRTSEDEAAQKFFANPNEEAQKYQVIVATSTLSTGVSIDVKWFDAVYGIFDPSVYTFQDCDQAISRVRNCDSVKVWIHRGPKPTYASEEAIRSGPVRKELLTRSHTNPDGNGRLSDSEELYMNFEARIRWCEQQWKCDRTNQFIELKDSEGWWVETIPTDPEKETAGSELLKLAKDPTGDKYCKSIFMARNLDEDEFDWLSQKKNLRGNDARAVKKYWIAKFYELRSTEEVTMAQIRGYNEKNLREIVKHAKLLKDSRIATIERDRTERDNPKSGKAFTSYDHRTLKRDIFIDVQTIVGIKCAEVLRKAKMHVENEDVFTRETEFRSPNSREYRAARKRRNQIRDRLKMTVEQEQIDKLASYVSENLGHVNLVFATNFKSPTALQTKTKVFNSVMGQLGIEVKKKPKPKDQEGFEYIVDYDRVAELVATKDINELINMSPSA